jgi:hypothetical protein
MMRYVLNSAVISRPGHYEYKLLTELEADVWLKHGRFTSRVGYKIAAQFLDDRFKVHCPLSREPVAMQPGDEGLVVRLKFRLPDDQALKVPLKHQTEDWEIGLLKRTA